VLALGEVAALSDEEIEAEIRGLLRPDERFDFFQKHYWYAEVWRDPCESLWRNTGFDKRLLLLDAYGWLWARLNPSTSHLWTSRRQELPRPPTAWKETSSVPDPEDLDPSEVDAVYGKK
jgi:hypothetical protein